MASHQTASEFGSGLEGAAQTAPERYAADLTAALAFYRDDQYAEAAGQLARVSKGCPRGVEAQVYLRIPQLHLRRNAEAVAALATAQHLDLGRSGMTRFGWPWQTFGQAKLRQVWLNFESCAAARVTMRAGWRGNQAAR